MATLMWCQNCMTDVWTWDWVISRNGRDHRSIYKYRDTGLPSLIVAKCDPFKLTSPAQHMRVSQTCRLLHRPRGLARMRHRENRRDCEFMLGNSRMKLTRCDACWAGEVSSKGSRIGCQCCPCGRDLQATEAGGRCLVTYWLVTAFLKTREVDQMSASDWSVWIIVVAVFGCCWLRLM